MKKVQKFLSVFAVVIIIMLIIMIIQNMKNCNYAKESLEKVITFSKMALEENAYGQVQETTKKDKHYEEIAEEIKTETKFLNEVFEESGLKGVIYNYVGQTYQLEAQADIENINYELAVLLIISMFISLMICFVTEVKYTNFKKYLKINLLMILIIIISNIIISILKNTITFYENWYEILWEADGLLTLILIYLIALITNIKINMGKSLRINIIYAVFAILIDLILYQFSMWYIMDYGSLIIYIILAIIDAIYNIIRIKTQGK